MVALNYGEMELDPERFQILNYKYYWKERNCPSK